MSSPLIPSRSFSPSLSMESPEAVSSVFLPLPPEPPDPDLDVMLLVDHPVPPGPPHPPPILIDASVLFVQPLLMHPLLAEADLSSSLTTRRVSLLHPVSKPRNLVSCGEHVSFKSSLRKVPYYQQEAGVIEISVARFLGLLTADCKFTRHFKFSRNGLRMLKFWRWWVFCTRFLLPQCNLLECSSLLLCAVLSQSISFIWNLGHMLLDPSPLASCFRKVWCSYPTGVSHSCSIIASEKNLIILVGDPCFLANKRLCCFWMVLYLVLRML